MKKKSKSTTTGSSSTNQTQTTTAPTWAQPTIERLGGMVSSAVDQVPRTPFQGDYFAGPTAGQTQGLQMQRDAIPTLQANAGLMQTNAQNLMGAGAWGTPDPSGRVFPGYSDGFGAGNIQAAVEAAARPTLNYAIEQLLPNMQSAAIEAGAFGGTQNQVTLPSLIARDVNQQITDTAAQLAYEDFDRTRNYNFNLMDSTRNYDLNRSGTVNNLLAAASGAALMPGQIMFDTGTQQQGLDQIALDNAQARYRDSVTAPFQGLDVASSLIQNLALPYSTQGLSGTTNSTQTTKTVKSGSPLEAALGIAGMAAGAFGAGGPLAGVFGKAAAPALDATGSMAEAAAKFRASNPFQGLMIQALPTLPTYVPPIRR